MNCETILLDEKPVLYDGKSCSYCGCKGIAKKSTLKFKYCYSAKMCYFCIDKLGGIENARDWLEKNAKFDNNYNIYFSKNKN
jgi:hypothetical protein